MPAVAHASRPVYLTAIAAAVIIAAAGWATHSSIEVMAHAEGWVNHTHEVEFALEQLLSALHDVESGERTYLIVGQESLLEPYTAARPRIDQGLQRIESLTRDNAAQQLRVAALRSAVSTVFALFERAIELRRSGATLTELADIGGDSEQQTAKIRQLITEMEAVEQRLLLVREANVDRARVVTATAQASLVILSLLQIAALLFVARGAADRIRQGEQRLAVIFTSIGDAVIATDGDGRIERMNPVAERLTGWNAKDAAGQPIEDVFRIINEETRAAVESPVRKMLREGGIAPLANHTVLIAKDGAERPIEDSAAPIGNDPQGGGGVVLVFRDATTQRELERARADSEARFRRIADDMPQIVYVVDERGEMEYLNQRWAEYSGCSGTQSPLDDVSIHPDDRVGLAARWAAARREETVLDAQIRMRDRNGKYHWFLTRAVPMRNSNNDPLRWYGTSTNIDEQVQARDALADAHRRKDEFLVALSHELRGPLAPIRNAVQLLRSPAVDANKQRWASEVIERQVQNMALLLDELLDVSRITRGTIVLHKEVIVLRTVIDAAVELARPLIEARGHILNVEGKLDMTGEVDPLRITQTIGNLLTNAAKYSDTGGRIGITADGDQHAVWISIRDTGIGLAADQVAKVFELFAQVKSASDRSMGGLGIGLALVKGFVELHGGQVTAASDGPGLGSEFRIVLPRSSRTAPEQAPQDPG
jgi:PAS domain S-box-containing protein